MVSTLRPVSRARALAIVATMLVGCAGLTPTAAPTTPSPTVAPTGPFAIRAGTLPAGNYITTTFRPRLTFTIDAGWNGMFPDDTDEIALNLANGAMLAITRVERVIDPADRITAVPAPGDLISWFTVHPELTAEAPRPASIAGLDGHSVDVIVTSDSEPDIFAYESGNMSIPAGTKVRYYVLPLDGPDLTIVVAAPRNEFDAVIEKVQPVLDSLVLAAGG